MAGHLNHLPARGPVDNFADIIERAISRAREIEPPSVFPAHLESPYAIRMGAYLAAAEIAELIAWTPPEVLRAEIDYAMRKGPHQMINLDDRHPSTQAIARYFENAHLPGHLRQVSEECRILAEIMIDRLPDGPELTAGLQKLLEAKDCFVRAALDTEDGTS